MPSDDSNSLHAHGSGREHALSLDTHDSLCHTRQLFLIPSRAQIKARSLPETESGDLGSTSSIYLCGNSLGLQPRVTSSRMQQYLSTWATQGVYGHFKPLAESPLPTWLDADARASESMAPIVGAHASEVAVMQTLTANLHLLFCAFYKPNLNGRHKIIIESQAFPSDHFAAESQILHHSLRPAESLVILNSDFQAQSITTSHVLSVISAHAADTAIILLPGIQYYTGQLLDIPVITAAAHSAGIFIIWDLAHAVGNVPLQLHDWNVDAAVWCSYKYLNAGPGAVGGLFVHDRNAQVSIDNGTKKFTNRLSGWWGSEKAFRFKMDNHFSPIPGAAGFQLSNPSILDITSLTASLEVFRIAGGMVPLREKSIKLTAYLEDLLHNMKAFSENRFEIITPKEQQQRGAQLSLKLVPGILDVVMKELEERGVVVDERRPDVIRVSPAPLYSSFEDCWLFVEAFEDALNVALLA